MTPKEDLFIINHFKELSLILQEYESNVIECGAIKFINDRGHSVTSYNYDGFQIIKNDNFIISDLNVFIKSELPCTRHASTST